MLSRVIAKNIRDVFLRHSVDAANAELLIRVFCIYAGWS